ncbi:hypothetical protein [Methylobacterium gnaphalii]|uniref:hypothetical protein n=1 Tax=Methylobacterium gnaphalii TaxID=1010610 RepID=UPI001478D56F|nr:hypothetical protein [Methylobacterium gnaphalii]GJD70984.1 hypothetical protein MMMDOFMJ_3938 [Methylobacterium gnaphalii]
MQNLNSAAAKMGQVGTAITAIASSIDLFALVMTIETGCSGDAGCASSSPQP